MVDSPTSTPSSCARYPIPWPADPTAQTTAEAELATFAPAARLTWDQTTGTLHDISDFDISLPCPDGADANVVATDLLSAHRPLFQIDLEDWRLPVPTACETVTTESVIESMARRRLATHPEPNDLFTYALTRVDTTLHVKSVFAHYVPLPFAGLEAQMAACTAIDAPAARAVALAGRLRADTFQACQPTGTLAYVPHANDTFVLDPEAIWEWESRYAGTRLTGTITLRVIVDPSNYTDALLASSAKCPVLDPTSNDFTVGFAVAIDIQTGEIVSVTPGLDCVVC